ncbi:MAG: ubiquitin-conjugating enzyme E2 32-like [Trebouxia sp. A1-2]|nr:MAG: ubiquitin-conjugating enzyme E2 32-like [Trebouxia sp. A1-2]
MDSTKYNLRNPAVKRIMQEMREIQRETSGEIMAEALEDNIFEWHFAIRGPPDTEFEGGIYHGRIILPPEYPFKPPSFIMISPSGRFETGVKICLSMSSHHPEHWQPSWSVRVALVALIAFLPTSGHGAIGSLDFSKQEKRVLAVESRKAPPKYGSEAKQQIGGNSLASEAPAAAFVQGPPAQPSVSSDALPDAESMSSPAVAESTSTQAILAEQSLAVQQHNEIAPAEGLRQRNHVLSASTSSASVREGTTSQQSLSSSLSRRSAHDWEDLGLTVLAVMLSLLIAIIVLRKIVAATGASPDVSMETDLASFE